MTRDHGIVTKWFADRGFGFIVPDSRQPDVFVHIRDLPEDIDELEVGTPVTYVLAPGKNGRQRAADVRID